MITIKKTVQILVSNILFVQHFPPTGSLVFSLSITLISCDEEVLKEDRKAAEEEEKDNERLLV